MLTKNDLAAYKNRLSAKRVELEKQSDDTTSNRSTVVLDQQSVGRLSRMDALQQQAMAKATEQRRTHEIMRVQSALARIAEGEFGYCTDCGEPIAKARLEYDPSLPWCLECATSR